MFVKIKSFVDSIAAKTLLITAGNSHSHYLNCDCRMRTVWIATARPLLSDWHIQKSHPILMVLVFSPLFAENGWPPEHGRDHDELVDILKVKVLHLILSHCSLMQLSWFSSCHSSPSVCLFVCAYIRREECDRTLRYQWTSYSITSAFFHLSKIFYTSAVIILVCFTSTHSCIWTVSVF